MDFGKAMLIVYSVGIAAVLLASFVIWIMALGWSTSRLLKAVESRDSVRVGKAGLIAVVILASPWPLMWLMSGATGLVFAGLIDWIKSSQ
jgi:hypothetical protein